MKLNLKQPIIFFDLETTGLDVANDRIVEISTLKVMPNGDEETKTRRLNPTIPISAEASAIHHITNEDVTDCPTFKQIAKNLANYIEGCDIAGYNSLKFDIPLLAEEFLRAGVNVDFHARRLVDVQNIFHKLEQRTLVAAYKFYCKKDLVGAHGAQADAEATYEVLKAQLDRYPEELKNEVQFLAEFSTTTRNVDYAGRIVRGENGVEVFNFGKYKGKSVAHVLQNEDRNYYDWMMKSDFALDTKRVLTQIKLRTFGK